MRFWRDTAKLWRDAWSRSPLRVVVGVACMLALLATVIVIVSDTSDATTTSGRSSVAPPAPAERSSR